MTSPVSHSWRHPSQLTGFDVVTFSGRFAKSARDKSSPFTEQCFLALFCNESIPSTEMLTAYVWIQLRTFSCFFVPYFRLLLQHCDASICYEAIKTIFSMLDCTISIFVYRLVSRSHIVLSLIIDIHFSVSFSDKIYRAILITTITRIRR